MKKGCGVGKIGTLPQKQLLTSLMKPMNRGLSISNAQQDFHLRVERARLNYSTPHRKDDKPELPINEFYAFCADLRDGEK